jgi:hypothetical protein
VRAIALFSPLLLLACGTRTDHVKKTAPATVAWRQLGTWSGRGNAQTESFTSDTGTLRVRWAATAQSSSPAAPAAPSFRLAAHSAISGRLLQPVVEHAGAGEGVSYVQQDPHVLYMVVESNQAWKITVEEAVSYR